MRIVNSLVAGFIALVVILFAVSNRTEVEIALWPLPIQATLGLYAVVLIAVLAGFLAGMIAAWLGAAPTRRDRRRLRGQVKDLEQSLARAKEAAAVPPTR